LRGHDLLVAVSLLVYVVVLDAVGEEAELGEPLAAGFESWRTEVWGSDQVRALGAELFPRLASGNPVIIARDEVAQLQHECSLLRENLKRICDGVDRSRQDGLAVDMTSGQVVRPAASEEVFRELVSVHLANIEDAAQRAAQLDGEVRFW